MSTPEYFARIVRSVNFPLLQTKLIVVVGVGMVGSQIAEELANCGVHRLRFIDHDILERVNLSRHALNSDYLDQNKAEGLATYLARCVEGLQTEAVPRKIDRFVSDNMLDRWLEDADLVVAATDDRETQRRVGQRALVLGVPSVFPALYVEGGGEIVVQLDDQLPCFSCWDEFRPPDEPLRGAQALNLIALPIIYTSLRLCLGLLDPAAQDREIMRAGPASPPYQVFGLNRFGALRSAHLPWRPTCPVCSDIQAGKPPPTAALSPRPSRSAPRPASRTERFLEDFIQSILNVSPNVAEGIGAVALVLAISVLALAVIVALHLFAVLLCGHWSCPPQ